MTHEERAALRRAIDEAVRLRQETPRASCDAATVADAVELELEGSWVSANVLGQRLAARARVIREELRRLEELGAAESRRRGRTTEWRRVE